MHTNAVLFNPPIHSPDIINVPSGALTRWRLLISIHCRVRGPDSTFLTLFLRSDSDASSRNEAISSHNPAAFRSCILDRVSFPVPTWRNPELFNPPIHGSDIIDKIRFKSLCPNDRLNIGSVMNGVIIQLQGDIFKGRGTTAAVIGNHLSLLK